MQHHQKIRPIHPSRYGNRLQVQHKNPRGSGGNHSPRRVQGGALPGNGASPASSLRSAKEIFHMRHHSQETAPSLYVQAAKDAFRKLDPRVLVRNPVMFVVAVGCVFTTASFFSRVVTGADAGFSGQISLWLWFTVLFANFAEALAEGRGKAQADTLRSARTDTVAHRLLSDGTVETVSASELAPGDRVVVEAGDMIPADGTVVEGVAAVDESAITGESAPVIRESGGDRSAVTGGTTVLSDRIVVNVTQEPGKSFLDRMIALVEGAERQKTPNEIALNILLAGLTLIFMLVVVTLKPLGLYHGINIDMVVLVALLVCLIPTTISGLLAAIGIAGMDRLLQRNVLALSGRAVEAAGDVDVLLLDKTGTITLGNRMASAFLPLPGVNIDEMMQAACLASSGDETPEGRSIVELGNTLGVSLNGVPQDVVSVPFTAETRMSGVDAAGEQLRKGATDSVLQWVHSLGLPERREELKALVDPVAREGGTPLVVASSTRGVLGVIQLKDVVKPGMRDRFDRIRAMGIIPDQRVTVVFMHQTYDAVHVKINGAVRVAGQKQRLKTVGSGSGPDLIGRAPLLRGVALGVHQANSFPASSLAGMRAAITSRISPCS